MIVFHKWGNCGTGHNTWDSIHVLKMLINANNQDTSILTSLMLINENNLRFRYSPTGNNQPHVRWQSTVKEKHLHTLKVYLYQHLEFCSRWLHKNWKDFNWLPNFTVTTFLRKAEEIKQHFSLKHEATNCLLGRVLQPSRQQELV